MSYGTLYEQAVDLSPKAARIAVVLLAADSDIPAPLRRSLSIALSAASLEDSEKHTLLRLENHDAQAARSFLASCKKQVVKTLNSARFKTLS